ncbi:uncharacterized protein F4807DRAFT_436368 [Annulohypoxylon truncatum]|uniref:uncharacterized protein n=1 Tax=Annulohypoxylon truncatum TaxID=327061 RepID=UPI002007412D|nr:uncharacterized protein F4807DRAFT_436368 [Annulohypoxylon truncatum]KAI1207255.1 hypothetical protein F4807DRAFT_436368 [Annulohypoxylon truncatum]
MSQQPTTNQPPNICALTPINHLFPDFPNFPPLRARQRPTQIQTQTQTQIQHPPSRTYRLPSFSSTSSSSSSSSPSTSFPARILPLPPPLPIQARPRTTYQPQPQLFPQQQQQQQPSNPQNFTLAPSHENQYIKLRPITTTTTTTTAGAKPARRRAVKTCQGIASSAPESTVSQSPGAGRKPGKGDGNGNGTGAVAAQQNNTRAGLVLLEPKVRTSAETALGFASATWDRREGWLCRTGAPGGGRGEGEGVIKEESADR